METLDYYMRVVRPMQAQFVDPTIGFTDRYANGEEAQGLALDLSAEIVRYLNRTKKKEAAFFYDREILPYVPTLEGFRGETIRQMILQQGSASVLVEGGSLRPPTLDHLSMMIQTMKRFGFTQGKFLPANKYKTGAISNAAAMLLSQVAVEHFNEALDANSIFYSNFNYQRGSGARWEDKNGKQYRVQVDSTEIDIKNPIVDGEDARTLLAFEALKAKVGGDPRSVFWLAGGDSFASLPKWNKHWKKHLELANWIVISRPEFDGHENNVSFESHDPIRAVMPEEVMQNYSYYFDHATQTHVYENKDPLKPNIYVVRLAKNGFISSSSVRASLAKSADQRLIARAGTTKSVFEACLSHGFFEDPNDAPPTTCEKALKIKPTRRVKEKR
jgi:nicotinic acid mononucleotide adenylyltransferase